MDEHDSQSPSSTDALADGDDEQDRSSEYEESSDATVELNASDVQRIAASARAEEDETILLGSSDVTSNLPPDTGSFSSPGETGPDTENFAVGDLVSAQLGPDGGIDSTSTFSVPDDLLSECRSEEEMRLEAERRRAAREARDAAADDSLEATASLDATASDEIERSIYAAATAEQPAPDSRQTIDQKTTAEQPSPFSARTARVEDDFYDLESERSHAEELQHPGRGHNTFESDRSGEFDDLETERYASSEVYESPPVTQGEDDAAARQADDEPPSGPDRSGEVAVHGEGTREEGEGPVVVAIIDSDSRIVLPPRVRDSLGIEPGKRLHIRILDIE
jgi:hypothetical protein